MEQLTSVRTRWFSTLRTGMTSEDMMFIVQSAKMCHFSSKYRIRWTKREILPSNEFPLSYLFAIGYSLRQKTKRNKSNGIIILILPKSISHNKTWRRRNVLHEIAHLRAIATQFNSPIINYNIAIDEEYCNVRRIINFNLSELYIWIKWIINKEHPTKYWRRIRSYSRVLRRNRCYSVIFTKDFLSISGGHASYPCIALIAVTVCIVMQWPHT